MKITVNFSHSKSIDVQYMSTSSWDQIIIVFFLFAESRYLVFVAIVTKALILLPLLGSGSATINVKTRQSWNSEFIFRLYQDHEDIFLYAYAYIVPLFEQIVK